MNGTNLDQVLSVVELYSSVMQDIIDTWGIQREAYRELVRLFQSASRNEEFISK